MNHNESTLIPTLGYFIMLAIFLDIETSGLDSFQHRCLEIAFKILDPGSGQVKFSYHNIVKQPLEIWNQRDPQSVEINGFTWEKLQSGKDEEIIKKEIMEIFSLWEIKRGKAVYICQNPSFDRGFFCQLIPLETQEASLWPYHWLDFASMYWALMTKEIHAKHLPFPSELNLSKNSIAELHGLPAETHPHSATNGVDHLIECYRTVVGFNEGII